MAQLSSLETRLCLVWNAKNPDSNGVQVSPPFSFLESVWCLRLTCEGEESTNVLYQIELEQEEAKLPETKKEAKKKAKQKAANLPETKELDKPFSVTTYIESEVMGGFTSAVKDAPVRHAKELIWMFEEYPLREAIPDVFSDGGKWRIVCAFRSPQTSKPENMNETMLVLDPPDSSPDFPSDPQSLSVDFSNLLEEEALPDVKLTCGDRTFSAHRTVLAARSEVFAGMFRSEMIESETGVVDIVDVEPEVLGLLLKFLYTGKLEGVSVNNVSDLCLASDKYGVQGVKRKCSDWMIKHLTKEDSFNFLSLADKISDDALKEKVISFICGHKSLLVGEDWLKFRNEFPGVAMEVYQSYVRTFVRK